MSPSSNGSGSLVLSEKIRVRLPVGTLQAHSLVSSGRRSDKSEVEVQFLVRLPRVVNAVGITIQTSGRGFESRRSPGNDYGERSSVGRAPVPKKSLRPLSPPSTT